MKQKTEVFIYIKIKIMYSFEGYFKENHKLEDSNIANKGLV